MLHLGLTDDFKRKVLQWNGAAVPMKDPIVMLGQKYFKSCEMHEVAMQTAEPYSTTGSIEIMVKNLDSDFDQGIP